MHTLDGRIKVNKSYNHFEKESVYSKCFKSVKQKKGKKYYDKKYGKWKNINEITKAYILSLHLPRVPWMNNIPYTQVSYYQQEFEPFMVKGHKKKAKPQPVQNIPKFKGQFQSNYQKSNWWREQ